MIYCSLGFISCADTNFSDIRNSLLLCVSLLNRPLVSKSLVNFLKSLFEVKDRANYVVMSACLWAKDFWSHNLIIYLRIDLLILNEFFSSAYIEEEFQAEVW